MSIRRRSTIHDLASLRLHPDGSRVQNPHIKEDDLELNASQQNLSSRRAHYVGKDAKGNWIAKDAGGRGFVKEIKTGAKRKSNANSSDEEIQLESERHNNDLEEEAEQEGKRGMKDNRAKKRRTFYEDYSFLEDAGSMAGPSRSVSLSLPPETQDELDVPSSDFLKSIHHFASNYYHDMGILYDAGKEARAERKSRKLQRMQDAVDHDAEDANSSLSSVSDCGFEDEREGADEGEVDEEEERSRKKLSVKKKRRRSESLRKDMYKAFDGSALMAIGVLMQEHMFEMVDRKPSEGWVREAAEHSVASAAKQQNAAGGKRRRRKKTALDDTDIVTGHPQLNHSQSSEKDDGSDASE